MKKPILIILILVITLSCSKESEDNYSYTFQENAQLVIEPYFEGSYMKGSTIVNGSNLVFSYVFEAAEEENIADDEYSEIIRFEIEPGLTEFSYSNSELNEINAVYSESCFCDFSNELKNTLPKGTISGTKISETKWDIMIDVTFYTDDLKNISNSFSLKK